MGLLQEIFNPTAGLAAVVDPLRLPYRKRRAEKFLLPLLERHAKAKKPIRILDCGGSANYWQYNIGLDVLDRLNCVVEIVNIDTRCFGPSEVSPRLVYKQADGRALEYPDNAFDVAHSNSVIEHVGDWNAMKAFAHEMRRVASSYFIQVPNFSFPYEVHFRCLFFHWLPEQVRARLLMRYSLGVYRRCQSFDQAMAAVDGVRLLDRRQMEALFPDADIIPENVAGFPKSLMAIRVGC